jgi:hypothetical protein
MRSDLLVMLQGDQASDNDDYRKHADIQLATSRILTLIVTLALTVTQALTKLTRAQILNRDWDPNPDCFQPYPHHTVSLDNVGLCVTLCLEMVHR